MQVALVTGACLKRKRIAALSFPEARKQSTVANAVSVLANLTAYSKAVRHAKALSTFNDC